MWKKYEVVIKREQHSKLDVLHVEKLWLTKLGDVKNVVVWNAVQYGKYSML